MSFFDALPLITSCPLTDTEYASEYSDMVQLGTAMPFLPNALYRLSHLYRFAGRKDVAHRLVDLAFELPHDRPDTLWHRAQEMIRRRDFVGWAYYQTRFADPLFRQGHKYDYFFDARKMWDLHEDLCDKTLLVIGEQGFGDSIQMLRYLPAVRPLVGKLKATVQPAMRRLVWGAYGDILEPPEPMPNPEHDRHVGIMSLPGLLGTLDPLAFSCGSEEDRAVLANNYNIMPLRFSGPVGDLGGTGLVWRGDSKNLNEANRSMTREAVIELHERLREAALGPFYSFQL